MKILVKNQSIFSRLKYHALLSARSCKAFLNGSQKIWSDWNPEVVPQPEDSERCIEIPWVARAMTKSFGLWLDIGFAHAEDRYWHAIYQSRKRLFRFGYGLDATLPSIPNPLPVHVQADLITDSFYNLPKFDVITCISTLEHIGCDNRIYNPDLGRRENPSQIQVDCLKKMLAQLTGQGHLLLTLPYGKYQDNQWFLQYDANLLRQLKTASEGAAKTAVHEDYYRLVNGKGWVRSRPEDMTNIVYHPDEKRAAGVVLIEFA